MKKAEKIQVISRMLEEYAIAVAEAAFAKSAYGKDRPEEYRRVKARAEEIKNKILKAI